MTLQETIQQHPDAPAYLADDGRVAMLDGDYDGSVSIRVPGKSGTHLCGDDDVIVNGNWRPLTPEEQAYPTESQHRIKNLEAELVRLKADLKKAQRRNERLRVAKTILYRQGQAAIDSRNRAEAELARWKSGEAMVGEAYRPGEKIKNGWVFWRRVGDHLELHACHIDIAVSEDDKKRYYRTNFPSTTAPLPEEHKPKPTVGEAESQAIADKMISVAQSEAPKGTSDRKAVLNWLDRQIEQGKRENEADKLAVDPEPTVGEKVIERLTGYTRHLKETLEKSPEPSEEIKASYRAGQAQPEPIPEDYERHGEPIADNADASPPSGPYVAWVAHNRYQLTSLGAARLEALLGAKGAK